MSDSELDNIRHSLAHLLAAAVLEYDPEAKLGIGPAIDNGFYYDIKFSRPFSEEILPKLEKRMRATLPSWTAFSRKEVGADEAREYFKNNPYKLELIDDLEKEGATITLYNAGNFTDLCRGGHAENPAKEIKPDSFKLDRVAGAYWRGDEKNTMLTRIYGLAFASKAELDRYIEQREEAKKRDHRKIAREQDLLVFSDLVGSGMPLWTPRGNTMRNEIINYSRELNKKLGFEEVHTPNINKGELFKVSGHYDKYKEDMLSVRSQYVEDEMFLKPMNCPQHTQIYASRPRSYRDLPIRYADFANLYRDERPGELSGLTRLRSFAQDDGHIFCREEQIEEEISNLLETIKEALATYQIDYWMRLSLRDPSAKENYLGDDLVWNHSQAILEKLLKDKQITYKSEEGEAAFYGPKIDIMAVDALGREWQISTIQLDFSMPTRFKLTYKDSDGSEKTPVMIHRALIGSPDRFLGILIEHYAGAFPLWLSPVQAVVLAINDKQNGWAEEVAKKLRAVDLRVEIDLSSDSLGKKVRRVKENKVPYYLIIGDVEVEAGTVAVESRDTGKLGSMSPEELTKKLQEEITTRARRST